MSHIITTFHRHPGIVILGFRQIWNEPQKLGSTSNPPSLDIENLRFMQIWTQHLTPPPISLSSFSYEIAFKYLILRIIHTGNSISSTYEIMRLMLAYKQNYARPHE